MKLLIPIVLALALLAAACGDDDAGDAAPAASTTAADDTAADDTAADDTAADDTAADLSGVCPSPIVLQDNWFPAAEQAYLYALIGDAGSLDADSGIFRGPLADTGVDLEIRSGGPYIGQATTAAMQLDAGIHIGIVDTDSQVAAYDVVPTVAVFAPLEKTPQILMWNPEEYSFESFEDIGESDAAVLHFGGATFIEYMVEAGILRADQTDPSYDGSPATFVARNGALAQQAFVTTAAWNYANQLEEWMKPVDYLFVHDSGYEIYGQQLVVRSEAVEELRPCLEQLVPILQQSVVDHWTSPTAGNDLVLQVVEDLDSFWTLYPGMMEAAAEVSIEIGLVANGTDATIGNYDEARMDEVVALLSGVLEAPGLVATDLYSNEFIDNSIGF